MKDVITPLNPSQKAIARVKDPFPIPTKCNLCDGAVSLSENKRVYGRNFGKWPWIYICEQCGAYVGLHPFTNIPLGTLADADTRAARVSSKKVFIQFIEVEQTSRGIAYQRLAEGMGIERKDCHFGLFNFEQCNTAAKVINLMLGGDNGR